MKNRLDLNKKPIFLAADFATEEMCSFQDRSDVIFPIGLADNQKFTVVEKKNQPPAPGPSRVSYHIFLGKSDCD